MFLVCPFEEIWFGGDDLGGVVSCFCVVEGPCESGDVVVVLVRGEVGEESVVSGRNVFAGDPLSAFVASDLGSVESGVGADVFEVPAGGFAYLFPDGVLAAVVHVEFVDG